MNSQFILQFRFVEIGRVAMIAYGKDKGKLCVILDVIDQNRVRDWFKQYLFRKVNMISFVQTFSKGSIIAIRLEILFEATVKLFIFVGLKFRCFVFENEFVDIYFRRLLMYS